MKNTIIAISIAFILIVLAFILNGKGINQIKNSGQNVPINNVSIIDGVQVVEIKAKGGYTPRESVAKANIPTILKFNTKGTFDCSSSVRIPSMNVYKNLPQSGITDIDLGTPEIGTLDGSCGMGMYPFSIKFQE